MDVRWDLGKVRQTLCWVYSRPGFREQVAVRRAPRGQRPWTGGGRGAQSVPGRTGACKVSCCQCRVRSLGPWSLSLSAHYRLSSLDFLPSMATVSFDWKQSLPVRCKEGQQPCPLLSRSWTYWEIIRGARKHQIASFQTRMIASPYAMPVRARLSFKGCFSFFFFFFFKGLP